MNPNQVMGLFIARENICSNAGCSTRKTAGQLPICQSTGSNQWRRIAQMMSGVVDISSPDLLLKILTRKSFSFLLIPGQQNNSTKQQPQQSEQ